MRLYRHRRKQFYLYAKRDARERGVQVAEKEANMKKAVQRCIKWDITMNGNSACRSCKTYWHSKKCRH